MDLSILAAAAVKELNNPYEGTWEYTKLYFTARGSSDDNVLLQTASAMGYSLEETKQKLAFQLDAFEVGGCSHALPGVQAYVFGDMTINGQTAPSLGFDKVASPYGPKKRKLVENQTLCSAYGDRIYSIMRDGDGEISMDRDGKPIVVPIKDDPNFSGYFPPASPSPVHE